MPSLGNDTSEPASERYHALLQQQSSAARLETVARLSLGVREMVLAGLRQRFKSASEAELQYHLAVRLYGPSQTPKSLRPIPDDAG